MATHPIHSARILALNIKLAVLTGVDEDEAIRHELGIEEYPHIALFIEGAQVKFDGTENTEDEFMKFLEKKHGSYSTELTDSKHLEELLNQNGNLVLYFGNTGHPRFKVFVEASHHLDKIAFVHMSDSHIQAQYSAKKDHLYLLKNGEKDAVEFNKAWKPDRISRWVHINVHPRVVVIDENVTDMVLGSQSPSLVLLLESPKSSYTKELLLFFEENSSIFYENYYGLVCYKKSKNCKDFLEKVSFVPSYPTLIAVHHHKKDKASLVFEYPHDDLVTKDLKKWLIEIDRGTAQLHTTNDPRALAEVSNGGLEFSSFDQLTTLLGEDSDLVLICLDDKTEKDLAWTTVITCDQDSI